MTLLASTGHKAGILGPSAFEDLYDGGAIRVYSGAGPGSADAPATGTLLGTVTEQPGGSGLTFERDGPYVSKFLATLWTLLVSNTGTVGWFRVTGPGDDGTSASTSLPRFDGTVGLVGNPTADLILPTLSLVNGQTYGIDSFLFTIPPIPGA
jgi:hypothetical protein